MDDPLPGKKARITCILQLGGKYMVSPVRTIFHLELRKIELPSEALAKELQGYLQQRRISIQGRESETIEFPDNMKSSEWSILKAVVEKWASGRQLKIVESLKLESSTSQPAKQESEEKEAERLSDVKKKLDKLTPEMAEERYNYLQSRPIGELTDAEYDERLELAQRDWKKIRKTER